jgi:hypothetical protein
LLYLIVCVPIINKGLCLFNQNQQSKLITQAGTLCFAIIFMSYFMTTAGPWIDLSNLSPLELTPAEQAQYYIRDRHAFLSQQDGEPLYLVDDGETGTSHKFISAASSYLYLNGSLVGCTLFKLCKCLCPCGHVFRIWYASNEEHAHIQVLQCNSFEEVMRAIETYVHANQDIQIRYAGLRI